MNVKISSSVGLAEPIELDVEPTDTVASVVEQVAQIQAVDPGSISLVKDGRVLDKDANLKKAGIKDGDSLKAMPRDPIGGSQFLPPLSSVTKQRIQAEGRRIRDARIPMRFVSPLHVEGRLVGQGKWTGQDLMFDVHLPPDFPAKPPVVVFRAQPRPLHPNISPKGRTCLNHLQDAWTPQQNLVSVYEDLQWLLRNPNYRDPLHPAFMGRRTQTRPGSVLHRILTG